MTADYVGTAATGTAISQRVVQPSVFLQSAAECTQSVRA